MNETRDTPSPSSSPAWLVAQAQCGDGSRVLIRFLASKPENWNKLPDLITITWSFAEQKGSFETLDQDLRAFEDRLQPLWSSATTCLAVVTSFADCREWLFYCSKSDAFMQQFNQLMHGSPVRPLELALNEDPEWTRWHRFGDSVE